MVIAILVAACIPLVIWLQVIYWEDICRMPEFRKISFISLVCLVNIVLILITVIDSLNEIWSYLTQIKEGVCSCIEEVRHRTFSINWLADEIVKGYSIGDRTPLFDGSVIERLMRLRNLFILRMRYRAGLLLVMEQVLVKEKSNAAKNELVQQRKQLQDLVTLAWYRVGLLPDNKVGIFFDDPIIMDEFWTRFGLQPTTLPTTGEKAGC